MSARQIHYRPWFVANVWDRPTTEMEYWFFQSAWSSPNRLQAHFKTIQKFLLNKKKLYTRHTFFGHVIPSQSRVSQLEFAYQRQVGITFAEIAVVLRPRDMRCKWIFIAGKNHCGTSRITTYSEYFIWSRWNAWRERHDSFASDSSKWATIHPYDLVCLYDTSLCMFQHHDFAPLYTKSVHSIGAV